jgi:hypothetical protein
MRILESRMMKKTFGPRREEVRGYWRKMHKGGFMVCTAHLASLM